eukprot:2602221-Amphidinium_carterae.1
MAMDHLRQANFNHCLDSLSSADLRKDAASVDDFRMERHLPGQFTFRQKMPQGLGMLCPDCRKWDVSSWSLIRSGLSHHHILVQ